MQSWSSHAYWNLILGNPGSSSHTVYMIDETYERLMMDMIAYSVAMEWRQRPWCDTNNKMNA